MKPYWTLLSLLALSTSSWATPPKIAVSIAPLHSVVSYMTYGVSEPQLVLQNHSPHHGQMKPSQIKMFAQSDWVVWVGPTLEKGLEKAILKTKPKRVITLLDLPLPERYTIDQHEHHSDASAESHDHDDEQGIDPHVWLSPENMAFFAHWLKVELSKIDPDNSEIYAQNFSSFMSDTQYLSTKILRDLAPVRDKRFVVFHPAYGYYERFFKLRSDAALTMSPELGSTAATLSDIQARHKKHPLSCVFTEPQFNQEKAKAFAEANHLKLGQLDPLGNSLEPGRALYFRLLENITASLIHCLGGTGDHQ